MGPLPRLDPRLAEVTAYDVDLGGPGVHRGLPSTAPMLVVPLDEPLDVAWAGLPTSRTTGWSSVSGVGLRPAEIRHGGHQRGVQVALTPAGCRALLGLPVAALGSDLLTLEDVSPDLRHLPERLAEARPTDVAAVAVRELARVVSRRREVAGPRPEVRRALALLARGRRVEATAADVGWSRRHLATAVRSETGLSPKQWQRVARLQRSRGLLGHRPTAEVAALCGYADQSHLTREWTELAGCTPTTWLREEFPFLQDPDAVTG